MGGGGEIHEGFRRCGAPKARSGPVRIKFMQNQIGIAVIFGGRHDAVIQTLRTCLMRVMLRA